MPNYKLTYFNARGAAEPVRLMFAYAGVQYEDHRVTGESWPAVKEDQPFGQVPVLRIDGKPLPESKAIYRYIAREHGFYGANSWDAALIDIAVEVIDELSVAMRYNWRETDPVRKEETHKKITTELAPKTFANLEKCLKYNNNGDGWFVGDKLSLADIMFFGIQELVTKHLSPKVLEDYPKLKGLAERIRNQPAIAEWLAKRPVTEH